ncbi:uncharacterized protein LOC135682646 isoform X2 [Rhopilema esculentum]|uniref:uncharacterized protein LOC135682646 isoform X2 n=1 Tax=Rhopilema esculentum TaxID=499914 RepID=UPI0031E1CB53|eukprot:gene5454-630_t
MAHQYSSSDLMYNELLECFNETRRRNIKLLEEKRELLLRLQEETRRSSKGQLESIYSGEDDYFLDIESNSSNGKLLKGNHEWKRKYEAVSLEYAHLKTICEHMKKEIVEDKEENDKLKQLVCNLSADLKKLGLSSKIQTSKANDVCKSDEMEALKQQIELYQEDFNNERKDKEKLLNEKNFLEGQLQQASESLEMVSAENQRFRQCLNKVTHQKEHIISEIRRLSASSLPFSPVYEQRIPPDTRFLFESSEGEDVVAKSLASSSSRPDISKPSRSAFMGGPAVEDSKCC